MATRDDAKQAVIAYIRQNRTRLIVMSVSAVAFEIRHTVAESRMLSEEEIRSAVIDWASLNAPCGPVNTTPHPPSVDGRLEQKIKSVISTVTDGADIVTYSGGKLNLGISGLTADLTSGDRTVSAGVSWGGKLSVETDAGDFHFSGELSSTRWGISFSYPDDTSIPDYSRVGDVFQKGEASMRAIVSSLSGFRNLNDVAKVRSAIKNHLQPVKEAAEAVQGIAKAAPKGGISFGFSLNSPDPMTGQDTMPRGIEGQAVFTYRF